MEEPVLLDDVLEYIAEKTGDVQAAESFLLNLNQEELESMFDMAQKRHEEPVLGGMSIGGIPITDILAMRNEVFNQAEPPF